VNRQQAKKKKRKDYSRALIGGGKKQPRPPMSRGKDPAQIRKTIPGWEKKHAGKKKPCDAGGKGGQINVVKNYSRGGS